MRHCKLKGGLWTRTRFGQMGQRSCGKVCQQQIGEDLLYQMRDHHKLLMLPNLASDLQAIWLHEAWAQA